MEATVMSGSKRNYAIGELMTCVMARDFKDGELGAMGAASQVPMAAARLARAMHAPNLNWLSGGSGAINSKLPYLMRSAADYRNLFGGECRLSMEDIVDLEVRGRADFSCYGAIQVDKYGNLNMLCVGDYARPQMRGPGSVGLSLAAAFRRYYIYLQHHDRRIFVDRTDYISGPGFIDGSPERDEYVQPGAEGPCLVVTPLAVFDFDSDTRHMRLKSVHEGIDVQEVIDKTGFTPILPDHVPETTPPNEEELRLLRDVIDRERALRTLAP